MSPYVNTLGKYLFEAGKYAMKYHGKSNLKTHEKDNGSFVTDVDLACESLLIEGLLKSYPQHAILSEESGWVNVKEDDPTQDFWLIDPIDGTSNYIHGHPMFAISATLFQKKQPMVGMTFAPYLDELFVAQKGHGCHFNQNRVRMSATKANRLVLAASDSCHRDKNLTDGTPFIQGFRKLGALTLELAYTACGRIDGIVALPPFSPWDIAAGALMIAESGGIITDSQGEPITNLLECPSLVASHQHSHRQIIQWLNQGN